MLRKCLDASFDWVKVQHLPVLVFEAALSQNGLR